MLFTSVDVEALRYLRIRGALDPDLERALLDDIRYGWQKELTYRNGQGAFSGSGGPNGSSWLTAYCLAVFSHARSLVTIDDDTLLLSARWLESHPLTAHLIARERAEWLELGFA